ncbi:MAG TPA: amino acid permease, partial [Saprospiraceae bacterium]|nr:amino acid permease [Saprospiraceae bacterium]
LNTFVPLPQFSEEISQIAIGPLMPFENIGAKIASILLIVFLTIVNARGAKNAGILSQIFTWIIVICIIGIIIFGLTSSVGAFQNITNVSAQYPPADFSRYQGFGFIMVMVIAMRNAFWGYEGWISLGYIGAEIQNPDKSIPKALITGILIVIGIYVCINFTYLYVMPIDELLTKVNANENNIAAVVVVDKLFGNGGAYIVSAMILISTFGCTNATVLTASRIYYAMAQKQLFFPKAGILHPERKTPVTSLIYQCVWASLLVLSGSFDMLTDLLIFAAFIFYGITVYGVIVLRKKKSQLERPYKVIGYPIVPMIFVIFCVILVVVSFLETPVQSLIGVGLILSGLPFYLKWSRNKTITDSQSSH